MALPGGYTQLEYIRTSGTQYIDTGFTPDHNSRVVLDFASTDTTADNFFFGARYSRTSKVFTFAATSSAWRVGYHASTVSASGALDTERHVVDMNKNVTSLDGTVIYTAAEATFTAYGTAYIGALNSPTLYCGDAKIWSCRIYDNGMLVRDYVPALRCIDGAAGLYDLVGQVFYANAGTGVFTYPGYVAPVGRHNSLIDGAAYEITGSKVMVDGTVYDISKGQTLIGGTGYDINFGITETNVNITVSDSGDATYGYVKIDGTKYISPASLVCDVGTTITAYAWGGTGAGTYRNHCKITWNGTVVSQGSTSKAASYSFATDTEFVNIEIHSSYLNVSGDKRYYYSIFITTE